MPKYPALRHEKAILLPRRARLARIQPNRAEKRTSVRCWSTRDMSKVQGPDEGDQRTHLPPAAEVEMPEMRQSQDAESAGRLIDLAFKSAQ
jgi:5-formaminoimidazole-4-carboxamide-1-beta-D-ribofuranosyl 5'-monophosphate synthetase